MYNIKPWVPFLFVLVASLVTGAIGVRVSLGLPNVVGTDWDGLSGTGGFHLHLAFLPGVVNLVTFFWAQ